MYTAHYQGAAGVAVVAVLVLLYLLPALVAYINRRKHAGAILLLNLSLGWTFLGWVLALFLACMPDDSVAQASTPMPQALAFARPAVNEARKTNKTAPEESNAETEGAFAAPRRLILGEGPAPGSPVQFPEANSPLEK